MEGSVDETAKAVSNLAVDSSSSDPAAGEETISKNARKKEMKMKQKEEERRRKEEEKRQKEAERAATKVSSQSQKPAADDEDMDPTQYLENRKRYLEIQKKEGKNPYPHKFFVSMSIIEYIANYGGLGNGDHLEDISVSLAGRIMSKRSSSSKLFFYDLHGGGAKVQVMADASKSDMDEVEFSKFHASVKRGDIVGVTGFPGFYKGLQVSRCKVWNIIDRTSVVKLERHHLKHHIRGAKDRSIYHQKIKIKHLANAASGHPLQSNQPDDYKPKSPLNSVINALDAFYRFSRPHTVIGTALSIVSVALLAVEKVSDMSPLFFTGVLEAIAAALMMNIYIVGLNQLSDIEIDKVNKPYLPLASGEYSFKTGVLIVASFSIMSFWLGWIVGSWPLFWALFTSFVLGTAYSINLPLLRWKRFAVAAAMCILAVRAVVVQLAFYLHMQTHVYRRPAVFSKPLIFATAFMSFFSVVIALFKDVPDLEGDKTFGIRTFTVRLGQKRVFWTCISLLEVAYTVAILVGATSPFAWSKLITVLGHSILALILWNRAKSVDIGSKTAITSCYMFIWKLFYTEYLLIPFVR